MFLDAARIIKQIKEKPSASSKLKMEHFAQIGVIEVFLEATPSVFLLSSLIIRIGNGDDEGMRELLWGSQDGTLWASVQYALFVLSFVSSIFSSAFGVSR